jgi:hypothetical protein
MIAKIIRGTGFAGALRYVMNDKGSHQDRATLLMTNTGGDDATSIAQEMRAIADTGKISKPVTHIVLSHNKDNLTNEQWCELATKYIDKMGYKDHQFALVRHNDTENDHVHLVINGVNLETGKGFKTNNERYRSLSAIKEITQEMGLTPNPTKTSEKNKAHGNDNIRTIQDAIDTVLSTNRGKGIKLDDFEKSLKALGVTAKRAENVTGIQGYSFKVDGSTEAFTGKRLGSNYKLSGLEDRGLLTPKVLQQQQAQAELAQRAQRKEMASFIDSLLAATQVQTKSQHVHTQATYSKLPNIGLDKQQVFEEEQKAREIRRQAQEQDFDSMQRQWAADRVRLNAERRSRNSRGIE